jgi:DNA polymerase
MPLDGSGTTSSKIDDVYLDFETYCEISVVDVGVWKYAEHPTCEVLCLSYSMDQGPIHRWKPGMPMPQVLFDAIADGARVHAHNAVFEYAIWHLVLKWPEIPLSQLHCTMALAATFSFPLSLEKGAAALRTENQKDKEGKRLLRKFSQLQTSQKKETKGQKFRIRPEDDPEDFENLCAYCDKDVLTEISIINALPRHQLMKQERKVFELDFKMNRRGVRIDLESVAHIQKMIEVRTEQLEKRVEEITGGIRSSKRQQIMAWAESLGYPMANYQSDYIQSCIEDPDIPAELKEVLEIRASLGKVSVKKYAKMLEVTCKDGTAKGMVQYHGAQRTGRFAGRLLQVHNLPRGNYSGTHEVAWFIRWLGMEDLLMLYDDPMELFSSMIRSMIIAEDGFHLFVSDFSNIEGRVLVWMAGQKDVMAQFARGDDVYKHMAAVIFSVSYDEVTGDQRFVGKQAVLGCGYGMGGSKFRDTCLGYGRDIGEDLAFTTVKTYRKKNSKVVSGWYNVERAAKEAIRRPGVTTETFKCRFRVEGDFLFIQLPSKRCLAYYKPRILDDRITYMGVDGFTGQWVRQETYGGKLVENIVQAVARDILVHSMLAVEEAGYTMLTTIHDELVATARKGFWSLHEFEKIMATPPDWGEDCPIAVEGWVGERYRK